MVWAVNVNWYVSSLFCFAAITTHHTFGHTPNKIRNDTIYIYCQGRRKLKFEI